MQLQSESPGSPWRPPDAADLILWDIIEEHLEEAGFLWTLWESSLIAPDFTLQEVAEGEEARLLAHIRGLVVGGEPVAYRVLIPTVEQGEDPELVFAAALALLSGVGRAGEDVLRALVGAEEERRLPLIRALQLRSTVEIIASLKALLSHPNCAVRAAAVNVLTFHHVELPDSLHQHLASEDPKEVSAGLRAAQLPYGALFRPQLERALHSEYSEVRDEALLATLIHGPKPAAWHRCRAVVSEGQPAPLRAMLLLALMGSAQEQALLLRALDIPSQRAEALYALGYHGTREVAEAALARMTDPELARLAGEAFTAVTGLDLRAAEMTLPPPVSEVDELVSLESEDLDVDLTQRPEDVLPVPDPEKVREWWRLNSAHFAKGFRYIGGIQRGNEASLAALAAGPMRRRKVLCLEQMVQYEGAFLLNPRMFASAQLAYLSALTSRDKGRSTHGNR